MWNSSIMNWGKNVLAWVTNGDESWIHHFGPEIKHWCMIQEMIVIHAKKAQSLGQKDGYTVYSYVESDRTVFVGALHKCSAIISEN